jgi:hypothetical protein
MFTSPRKSLDAYVTTRFSACLSRGRARRRAVATALNVWTARRLATHRSSKRVGSHTAAGDPFDAGAVRGPPWEPSWVNQFAPLAVELLHTLGLASALGDINQAFVDASVASGALF